MGGKRKRAKPPLDEAAIRQRLERAREEQLMVSIRRWIPDADRIDGFVMSIGDRWVALAKLDSLRIDGWCLLRLQDVQAIFIDSDSLEVKVLQARDQWPITALDVGIDDVVDALCSASRMAPLASVHVEFDRADIMWVGEIGEVDAPTMQLWEVGTKADWQRTPRAIDLEDVTRIEFGGDYETGLALVAGPRPRD